MCYFMLTMRDEVIDFMFSGIADSSLFLTV